MEESKELSLQLDGAQQAAAEEKTEVLEVAEASEIAAGSSEAAKEYAYLEDVKLTEEEQKMVKDFSEKIDLSDTNIVLQYGSSCQKKVSEFSDTALEGVKTKNLGEVGNMISSLVTELRGFDVNEEEKGLKSLFKKSGNKLTRLKAKYDEAEVNVNKIVDALEGHQDTLTKDIVMLDEMYATNLNYFKELSMYILAGKEALKKARTTTLVDLQNKAAKSALPEDAQAASDFASQCDRFEKKLADLEITRTISIQMAPQIRLIQSGDTLMVEKIQTTITNTIPLWKNQMVLALGLAHSEQAAEAQKEVNELTNELLKKNADTLHQGAVEIAKESERSIVDIETLQYTNKQLITTLDEVLNIQKEGRQKRAEAEAELARIENELKEKLLKMSEDK